MFLALILNNQIRSERFTKLGILVFIFEINMQSLNTLQFCIFSADLKNLIVMLMNKSWFDQYKQNITK